MYKKDDYEIEHIILLLIIIIILVYLLIQNFGYIENIEFSVPTGNVDIFEIDSDCCDPVENKDDKNDNIDNEKSVFKEKKNINKNKIEIYSDSSDFNNVISKKKNINTNKNKSDVNVNSGVSKELLIFDNYQTWSNKELRIFSNPAFEYRNVIAPGSSNSYSFVIRNSNDFDVMIDIGFSEANIKNINMNYKLKSDMNYLIGSEDSYVKIKNKKITNIKLAAKSQQSYTLEWKWIDSDNDTQIGFDASSVYKLSILIGVY